MAAYRVSYFLIQWRREGDAHRLPLPTGRRAGRIRHVIGGRVTLGPADGAGDGSVSPDELATGDAAKVTDEPELRILAEDASELILVNVPMQFESVGIWAGRA